MDAPPKTLCAKCFKSLSSNFIACHICKAKLHFICAKINDKHIDLLNNNINVVFNCNDCLSASSELLSLISSLSKELRELKNPVISKISDEITELKTEFNKLSKNLEIAKLHQNKYVLNKPIANNEIVNKNNAIQRSHTQSIDSSSNNTNNMQCTLINDDDASSITSHPTVASDLRSNTYDADGQHNDWINVRGRRRRNRVIAVGDNNSNDLDVVVRKKYLHVSSFKPSVTTDLIINFIEKNTQISKNHIECTRLVKKDADESTLKYVNFKIGVSPHFYNDIIKPNVWPMNIKIRPFIFFPRKPVELPSAT